MFALSLEPVISISSPTPKGSAPTPGAVASVAASVNDVDELEIVAGAVNVISVPDTV